MLVIEGQVEIKDSKLLDKMEHIHLEADVGDVILLHKHSIHCSLPNRSNDFRISADLRYNVAGQPSGRDPLPNFYVRSKNKKNLSKFRILNNGWLFGKKQKKSVFHVNTLLNILFLLLKQIKEIFQNYYKKINYENFNN